HPGNVRRLACHVDRTHVDTAWDSEARRGRCGGDPVLAGAGLRDHAALFHPLREQDLAQAVVELVGAGVKEILPLQSDRGAARAHLASSARRTASKNRLMRPRSLTPGALSTPDATSTASGRVRRIDSPTFSGRRPPETNSGTGQRRPSRRDQSNGTPVPPGTP